MTTEWGSAGEFLENVKPFTTSQKQKLSILLKDSLEVISI